MKLTKEERLVLQKITSTGGKTAHKNMRKNKEAYSLEQSRRSKARWDKLKKLSTTLIDISE